MQFNNDVLHYIHACIIAVSDVKIVNCTEGEVRLVNGSSPNKGRVEICIDQSWATVCSNGFDYRESRVICGQLGYQRYGILMQSTPFFSINLQN